VVAIFSIQRYKYQRRGYVEISRLNSIHRRPYALIPYYPINTVPNTCARTRSNADSDSGAEGVLDSTSTAGPTWGANAGVEGRVGANHAILE
jgi:hypothetical protein